MAAKKKSQKSLDRWTKQKWRTPSGKPSGKTGEVYAPAAKIRHCADSRHDQKDCRNLDRLDRYGYPFVAGKLAELNSAVYA